MARDKEAWDCVMFSGCLWGWEHCNYETIDVELEEIASSYRTYPRIRRSIEDPSKIIWTGTITQFENEAIYALKHAVPDGI